MTSRYRSRNNHQSYTYNLYANSAVNSYAGTLYLFEQMADELQPNYFQKKREGTLLNIGNLTHLRDTLEWNPGHTDWKYWNEVGGSLYLVKHSYIDGCLCNSHLWQEGYSNLRVLNWSGSEPDWPDSGEVSVEALARARSQAFDVATFLAELGKTVKMVSNFRGNVLSRARRILDDSRGQRNIAQRGMVGFAETWLEGRYGWRILAYDLQDINQSLIKLEGLAAPFIRGYAERSNESTRTVFTRPTSVLSYWGPYSSLGTNNHTRASTVCTQTMTKSTRAGSILQNLSGNLAFADPLVTAWEVIPYSFIVDWFTNLDQNIKAFSPFVTNNLLGSWISTTKSLETVTETIAEPHPLTKPSDKSEVTGTGLGVLTHRRVTRDRWKVEPQHSLNFKLNINAAKILDLASLFLAGHARVLSSVQKLTRV